MLKPRFLSIIILIFTSQVILGQSSDTLFLATARKNSIASYDRATVTQSGLYNGPQYIEPKRTNDEHPFFITDEWQEGEVEYRGQIYRKMPLLFDLTTDKVVSELFNGQPFVLVNEHLNYFTIGSHFFRRIENASVANSLPASGIYEILYDGTTQAIAKHIKVEEERIESNVLERSFDLKERFYIFHSGKYTRITNKSSLLKVLHDQRSQIKAFIRTEKIRFGGKDLSAPLSAVASYYDTLKPITE